MSYRCDVCRAEKGPSEVATVSRHNGAVPVWWCGRCLAEGKALIRAKRKAEGEALPPAHASSSTRPESCGRCTLLGRSPSDGSLACYHGRAPAVVVLGLKRAPAVPGTSGPPPEWCPKPPPDEPSRKVDLMGA